MIRLFTVVAGAYGVHLFYSSVVFGWRGFGPGPRVIRSRHSPSDGARQWLAQAGLTGIRPIEFLGVVAILGLLGALGGYGMFGAILPALVIGAFVATFPAVSYRNQRSTRREQAHEAWPRLIEEIRVLTSAAGYSVPQALFAAGANAPDELRDAFDSAHREWMLSTDFAGTIAVLQARLGDATADVTCETLLVAHEIGGNDLNSRLTSLAADRTEDVHTRKDARARQAGARFARRFVLLVPLGMAAAGLSVGTGRHAYQTPMGQLAVLAALTMVIGCWIWAGRIMRQPAEQRVFGR